MQSKKVIALLSLLITAFIMPSSFLISAAYGAHPSPVIYGTISEHSCPAIGTLSSEFTDSRHTQKLTFCVMEDGRHFLTATPLYGSCVEMVGVWQDPRTGARYDVPTPCVVPRPCDPDETWETWGSNMQVYELAQKMQVLDENNNSYNFTTKVIGMTCGFAFDLTAKKVDVLVRGSPHSVSDIQITIPYNLLYGNYTVLVDGKSVPFNVTYPSLSDIPDTAAYERYRGKFVSDYYFDKVLAIIKSGSTRSLEVAMFVTEQEKSADVVKELGGTIIYKANNARMLAMVPVREIPKLGSYNFISDIGNEASIRNVEEQTIALVQANFIFPEASGNAALAERRIQVMGTSVVPEFANIAPVVTAACTFTVIVITKYSKSITSQG